MNFLDQWMLQCCGVIPFFSPQLVVLEAPDTEHAVQHSSAVFGGSQSEDVGDL